MDTRDNATLRLIHRWRERVLGRFILATLLCGLPSAASFILDVPEQRSLISARVLLAVMYGCLAAIWVARRGLPYSCRLAGVLALQACEASWQAAYFGLGSSARITLVTTLLVALVFGGPPTGWIAVGIATMLYGIWTLLAASSMIPLDPQAYSQECAVWMLEGLALVVQLGPIFVILWALMRLLLNLVTARERKTRRLFHEMQRRLQVQKMAEEIGENERRLLGAEVHDNLCQQLTAALLDASAVHRALQVDLPEAAQRILPIRCILERSIRDAYSLARTLAPVELNPSALGGLLGKLAGEADVPDRVRCRYHESGAIQLENSQAALHLYRISQEALRNALRHAQAQQVTIRLEQRQRLLVLSIEDDGQGVVPGQRGGMGLQSMAYRAQLLGAELSILPRVGGGTVVRVELPVDKQGPRD